MEWGHGSLLTNVHLVKKRANALKNIQSCGFHFKIFKVVDSKVTGVVLNYYIITCTLFENMNFGNQQISQANPICD
jgi:hypothetical protein